MKSARELYAADERWWSDYQPIINSFGSVIIQADDADYQGDSYVVLRDGSRYGYLNFGWGSCSGCDALQACDSLEEVDNLINSLASSIHWEDSAEDLLKWMDERDWELQYVWHVDEFKAFLAQAKEALAKEYA
jgi:hypothetical protein